MEAGREISEMMWDIRKAIADSTNLEAGGTAYSLDGRPGCFNDRATLFFYDENNKAYRVTIEGI
jgi:hypothetical protein